MKRFVSKSVFGAIALSLALVSCEKDNQVVEEAAIDAELQKVQSHAASLGYKAQDATIAPFHFPDGTVEDRVYLEGDIAISPEEFFAMEQVSDLEKQFRTNNLVTGSNRTIDIIGYTGGGGFGLTNTQRTALQWAVNNYNRINNMSLNFRLTYGTNYQSKDIVVYRNPNNSNAGGSAGFPSNGRPNKFVQIWTGLDSANTNVNEHVITHEIGHSVGFRHSDFFSRQSCGQNTNEGSAGVGANFIPGTVNGWDPSSLMNACFSFSTNGEFNGNDVRALQTIY